MIVYNWTFPQFVIEPQLGDMSGLVTAMVWMCTGVDDETNETALISGRVVLTPPNPEQFVPFDQITQELAMAWLGMYISIDGVQDSIKAQILSQREPVQPTNPPFMAGSA